MKIQVLVLLFCLYSVMAVAQTASEKVILIKAGKFYNSEKAQFVKNQEILIRGNSVVEVGDKVSRPKDVEVIDLSTCTITPGLIDAHTHLLLYLKKSAEADPMVVDALLTSDADRVLRGAHIARTYLEAGITTIRDLGNSGKYLDVALRDAINKGYVAGPRMFVSGPILSPVGGQFYGLAYWQKNVSEQEYRIIKNVDDARFAVKEQLTFGADLIKICSNNSPNSLLLTVDEIKAIVETAHQYNRKVTAHATYDKAVRNAVLAGVDGIEHAYDLSDSTLAIMASRGSYLVPTDVSFQQGLLRVKNKYGKTGPEAEQMVNEFLALTHKRIKRAHEQNVMIVAGSDYYDDLGVKPGDGAKDVLIAYVEAGFSPAQVLQFATFNAAKALGNTRVGKLSKGSYADLAAFDGDLEKDFNQVLSKVKLVMKDGKILAQPHN
ncbi:amidohydrolase [Fibrisoma limi BUZ 3]|uniref:Amidohydrolase n=1 Tax=Fibrisoma limi BUZ 3 TaxID=1185876 RepID=I2GTR3_9BACT|nr:amidohydrolase family protein [Fibrisoma limi]CCH57293.1 amidohydrolase [Fibrisoma limi BUZ 3]